MKRKLALIKPVRPAAKPWVPQWLLNDVRELILTAREQVARSVNASLAALYWRVGNRIRKDILREKRAEYGEQIVSTLSAQLETEFGRGFGRRNIFRMIRFAEVFPDQEIVSTLLTQLGWSHFLHLLPLKDRLKRDFYAEMCRLENWSVRRLRQRIGGLLFERTALSKKPDQLIEQELQKLRAEDQLSPDRAASVSPNTSPNCRREMFWSANSMRPSALRAPASLSQRMPSFNCL